MFEKMERLRCADQNEFLLFFSNNQKFEKFCKVYNIFNHIKEIKQERVI